MTIRAPALLLALLLAGCASTPPAPPVAADAALQACAGWFDELDAVIDRHRVRDAEAERIAGFPGLRVDRLAAASREHAQTDRAAFAPWLARLQQLEAEGREVEIGNLPPTAFPIGEASDAAAVRTRSAACRDDWRRVLQGDAALRAALHERATVPDRYSGVQRALGLYPLLRMPFFAGVKAWEAEHQQAMKRWATAPPPTLRRYVPDDPQAPVFEIETQDAADRFGAPQWAGGAAPQVDTAEPVVYRRVTQTAYRGRLLTQLVYTLWFPERPPQGAFDLLAGTLDGVIVRLTLAPDGAPLLLDTIHACGCWHLFFPGADLALRDGAPEDVEWAHVAGRLPIPGPGERLVVRLSSHEHQVMQVGRTSSEHGGTRYALRDEQLLRSLPLPGGGRRSLYGPDGLVPGTERPERYLYWPMGIASAGATRQWGHHATAFVGRRHFDDADLIERRFVIPTLK